MERSWPLNLLGAWPRRVAEVGLPRLALITTVSIWLLVVLGGVVRVTGSGMGCGPDWPLCNGRVVPAFDLPTLIEFGHRLTAGVVSLLVLATGLIAWRSYRKDGWIVGPAIAAGAVLVVQILLGAVTVFLELAPTAVALHLGAAALLLGLLTVIATAASNRQSRPTSERRNGFFALTVATAAATYLLILIGAYMMGSGASLGCRDLPLCDGGQLLPAGSAGQLHMLHRFAAVAVGLLVAAVVVQARRRQDRGLATGAAVAGALYVAQVLAGIGNVLFALPPVLRVAHLALAFALWGVLAALGVLARRRQSPAVQLDTAGALRGETDRQAPLLACRAPVQVSAGLSHRDVHPAPLELS
ncbi:MAG: heme A synthase [Chloroflexi bacterium]|nr:heme A synthase [Chloroflexota bacterium]